MMKCHRIIVNSTSAYDELGQIRVKTGIKECSFNTDPSCANGTWI